VRVYLEDVYDPVSIPIVEINEMSHLVKIVRELHCNYDDSFVVLFDDGKVLPRFWKRYLFPGAEFRVSREGTPEHGSTPTESRSASPVSDLSAWNGLRMAKPVITFYPLQDNTRVKTTITLSDRMNFSYIHPLPLATTITGVSDSRSIQWDTTIQRNGTLTLLPSGELASYLFWEAESFGDASVHTDTRIATPVFTVSIDKFPTFLAGFMEKLGFGITERQDMVTFWGPKLADQPFVAIRFLSPEQYAAFAKLDLEIEPDHGPIRVVRLFALLANVAEPGDACVCEETLESEVQVLLGGLEMPEVGKEFCVFEWGGTIVGRL
jgi:hypothetical protein